MAEEKVVNGSCLCKAVTFRVTGKPLYNVLCYCENCLKTSGTSFHGASIFLRKQYTLLTPSADDPSSENLPNITVYADHATQSGKPLYRRFCSICGSKLSAMTPLNNDIISVPSGLLDSLVKDWKPDKEQFVANKPEWLPSMGDLISTMQGPGSADVSDLK